MEQNESHFRERGHEEVIANIVEKEFNQEPLSVKDLSTGYAGYVYAVKLAMETGEKEFAIKLMNAEPEPSFAEEHNNTRVYGVRWSNLKPCRDALASGDVPVPEIYSIGKTDDGRMHYAVMELLKGESIREFLATSDHPDMLGLHALTGTYFGKAHAIQRNFQGWVSKDQPYAKAWKDSFFESLESRFVTLAQKNSYAQDQLGKLRAFSEKKQQEWVEPKYFSLSHTDGFQGMAEFKSGKWAFSGVIDMEDHQFTDQRLTLAGHELSLEYEHRTAPQVFWDSYLKEVRLPEAYADTKDLFQLYYLTSWLPGVYHNARFSEQEKQKNIDRFVELIDQIIKS